MHNITIINKLLLLVPSKKKKSVVVPIRNLISSPQKTYYSNYKITRLNMKIASGGPKNL